MKIQVIRALEGRNIHSHSPLIEMRVDLGEYEHQPTSAYPEFVSRLLQLLPSLEEHHCSRGQPGGFVQRLREGTYFGHVIEHVALELQALAGMQVIYGKTRRAKDGVYNVFFEYESREAGLRAGEMAVEFVRRLLAGEEPRPVADLVAELQAIALRTGLGPSTQAIVEAARRRGIPYYRLGGSLIQLGYGAKQRRIWATITARTGCIGVDIASDKTLTKRLLEEAGIPVPAGGTVTDETEALELARSLGGPVVVKPQDGNQGKGVTLNLRTEAEIRAAFRLAQRYAARVIIERYIPGRQYRVLVVGGEVVAAAERIPARVVGDGRHSLRELIELVNQDPRRGEGHEKPLTKIRIDPVVELTLARQHLDLDYVPAKGEQVRLRDNANLSTGGTATDVTDQVHPQVADLCVRAARIVGLDVAGVDLVMPDIAQPLLPGGGAVIEVNAAPGLRMHLYPSAGKPRAVGARIVDWLFPAGDRGRIPIVAITGTNGKTTVTRLVNHILQQAGYKTGMTTSDGIYIDGRCVLSGDTTGPRSARTVLMDDRVEAAVLETARGGIIRGGLAFDYCDVACVTNISADHLGQDGVETLADLVNVKTLLLEAVRPGGAAVLNADDPQMLLLLQHAAGEPILFARKADNINVRKHVVQGGRAVYRRQNDLVIAEQGKERVLISFSQVPLTAGGRLAHNVENVLAAVACCLNLGLQDAVLRQALMTFHPDLEQNPGRFNHFRIGRLNVVLDYGHNPAGFRATYEAVQAFKPRTVRAVIGVPGDRCDSLIIAAGRTAGALFDQLTIKEDQELRGRKPGEVAALLVRGALQVGFAEENLRVILDEREAIREAVRQSLAAKPGGPGEDWLVIFFEKYQPALTELLATARSCGREAKLVRYATTGEAAVQQGQRPLAAAAAGRQATWDLQRLAIPSRRCSVD